MKALRFSNGNLGSVWICSNISFMITIQSPTFSSLAPIFCKTGKWGQIWRQFSILQQDKGKQVRKKRRRWWWWWSHGNSLELNASVEHPWSKSFCIPIYPQHSYILTKKHQAPISTKGGINRAVCVIIMKVEGCSTPKKGEWILSVHFVGKWGKLCERWRRLYTHRATSLVLWIHDSQLSISVCAQVVEWSSAHQNTKTKLSIRI